MRRLAEAHAGALSGSDNEHPLRAVIERYNAAWNRHDVDAIVALHAADMVFDNHTAGEVAKGPEVREHIAGIFAAWPDIAFRIRRLYVRDDLVVQEWTASATHARELRRGDLVAPASGRRVQWKGLDVIPFDNGRIKRKDVYSDSIAILRQVGLFDR
jgi:steroid delta-isomerase-like uncharacterized protein